MNTFNKALLSVALTLLIAVPFTSQQAQAQRRRASPHETNTVTIDGDKITLTYGRPYSKKPGTEVVRKIWGTGTQQEFLVPNGQAWRLGADEATQFTTEQAVMMGDLTVPAGTYTLYLFPTEDGTKLVVSTTTGKWGIPVDEKHDLGRVAAKKESMDKDVDQFTMAIESNPAGGGVIKMMWEKTQFSVAFTVKK
jgi:hypothetical protein